MSDVQRIAAQAEKVDLLKAPVTLRVSVKVTQVKATQARNATGVQAMRSWQQLPAHNFSPRIGWAAEGATEGALDRNPDIWIYRKRTSMLLRRYMRFSLEAGRLPSVIGREFFRAKITSYTSATFEDRVIFVHDVERCLERLDPFDRDIIARVMLQEHDHERAARMLQCTRKTIERRLPDLLDEMSEEFLRVGLLVGEMPKRVDPELAKPFLA